jgi:DNA-binding NarL/FixJ family response regulator
MAVTILHADRFELFHKGLKNLLEQQSEGFNGIRLCSTEEETTEAIRQYVPDILITDCTLLPNTYVLPQICSFRDHMLPSMKIIVLTMNTSINYFNDGVELGVDGYLYKYNSTEEIYSCLKAVSQGKKYYLKPEECCTTSIEPSVELTLHS